MTCATSTVSATAFQERGGEQAAQGDGQPRSRQGVACPVDRKAARRWASPDTIARSSTSPRRRRQKQSRRRTPSFSKPTELQIELHDLKQGAADGDLFDLKNESVETIAGTMIEKIGIDKAVKIARAILNSPEHDERERTEREQELAERTEQLTERAQKRVKRKAGTKKPKAG
jgi:hypothetical protein